MRYGYNGRQGGIDMRSVVLDEEKANLCGICGCLLYTSDAADEL